MSAARSATTHLLPLDGLRGIAIALVVWFHIWQITWLRADLHVFGAVVNFNAIPEAGFIGVDLFFFISGFCLFEPYARTMFAGAPRPTLATFAYRRALKILPSYYVSIAAAIALGWVHFASASDAFVQIASHAAFVHVFNDATYGGINGVLWSLAIEVQFYLVFPLVALVGMRRPLATCGALALAAVLYRLVVATHADARYELEQLPGTLDLFAAGIAAAVAHQYVAVRRPTLAARRGRWTALAVFGAIASAAALLSAFGARSLPAWPGSWEVWGRTALAFAFVPLAVGSLFAVPLWQRALANPVLLFLSGISYNLYLWHQPIARALRDARLPPWSGADAHGDPLWGLAFSGVAGAAAIAVALIFTLGLERPILRARPLESFLTKREPRLHPERV